MLIDNCEIITINTIVDLRGSLSIIEDYNIPFDIKRIFYIHGNVNNSHRGGHAHRKLKQMIIPISGSFIVEIDDGKNKMQYIMDSPTVGLYVCPMIWVNIFGLKKKDVCLVLTSDYYCEKDYIRNYDEFKKESK